MEHHAAQHAVPGAAVTHHHRGHGVGVRHGAPVTLRFESLLETGVAYFVTDRAGAMSSGIKSGATSWTPSKVARVPSPVIFTRNRHASRTAHWGSRAEGQRLTGISVHIAARIDDLAQPGEIWYRRRSKTWSWDLASHLLIAGCTCFGVCPMSGTCS